MLKYLIFSILFQIIAAGCPSGCVQYASQCLCFHSAPESFEGAKTMCSNLGGRLSGIQNLKINEFIFRKLFLVDLNLSYSMPELNSIKF